MIPNIVEEVYLSLPESERGSDRVDRCIAPTFVEEPSCAIHVVEKVIVSLTSKPLEARDLEIAPEVAVAPGLSFVLCQELEMIVVDDVVWILCHKVFDMIPQTWYTLHSKFMKSKVEIVSNLHILRGERGRREER